MRLVSVIIPTFNRAALLRDAIASVLAVDRNGFDLDVIVVDDGSTDETAAVARSYPVVYERMNHQGVSAARNRGMDLAKGDYLAFLDDDDVWLPHNLAPQLALLDEHPDYGAAFAQLRLTSPTRVPIGEPGPTPPRHERWLAPDFIRSWPQVGSLVVRTAVARAVGPFNPALHDGEDWDWVLRLAEQFPMGFVGVPVGLFRQRDDPDELALRRSLRGRLYVLRAHTRGKPGWRWTWMRRVTWEHRGWYADRFMYYAHKHARQRAWRRAARSVGFALRASPPHVAVWCVRSVRRYTMPSPTGGGR